MSQEQSEAGGAPSMQMMQLLWPAAIALQAIHVAAKLGLADLLADGPKTATELAGATQAHEPSLHRLMRALTSLGIFVADADRYRQTPLSDTLRIDHPQSMRRWALMLGAGFIWEPSGKLDVTLRTGQTAFEHVYGQPFFQYLSRHKEDAAIFNAAMSSMPSYLAAVVKAYDFSRFEKVVDVGGGHGAMLTTILAANPTVRGVLYDLPGVVAGAPPPAAAIADRLEIVAGDFFETVPQDGDAYVLKGIIHDWDDASAVKILKNCRRAIRPGGRLLMIETVLTATVHPAQAMMDVLMMVLTGGRERTEEEFRAILSETGFTLTRVIPMEGAAILESGIIDQGSVDR